MAGGGRRALPLPVVVGVVAVAALAAAGLIGYRRGRHEKTAEDTGAARASRQGELEEELVVLNTRLRALERRSQPPPVANASPPAAPVAEIRPTRPPPATAEDERQYFAAIESRQAAETRDPAWAEAIEQKLRQSAEGFGPRLTVEAARCGRAMCRLDIRREAGPQAAATMEELLRRAVRVLPSALVQYGDDPTRLVVYFVREGAEGFPPLVGREPEPR